MEEFTNPQFDNFELDKKAGITSLGKPTDITPRTILNDAERLIKNGSEAQKKERNSFPIESFPPAVRQIIRETNRCLNYPVDFIGASLLFSAGLAIGNSHRIQAKKTWNESPILYLALVGKSGTFKSHPLSFALDPIKEHDHQTFKEYEEQKKDYDYAVSLTKKEREHSGIDEPTKPMWKRHIVSDITPESLAEVHKFNKRGIALYSDELAGWFKNFNRYNNGSEEQFWLSAWSCKPVNIDRKSGEPILIDMPYISVAGTIQNGILKELSRNNRSQNGFMDRILFAFPDFIEKPYWNEEEVDDLVIKNWHQIISTLLELPFQTNGTGSLQPEILHLNPDAKELYKNWYNRNIDLSYAPKNEAAAGTFTKLNQYTLRFSLILELLSWSCGESNKRSVGVEALKGAIELADYFKNTALRVHEIVSNPLKELSESKQKLYEILPDNFTTAGGVEIANSLEIPERTFKRFLNEQQFFRRVTQGKYEKLI